MAKRPNILLITSDQQHYDTIGINNPRIKTPALDRLAREGVLFERAYCPNPVCSPTRASIITGLYPSAHHCWTIGVKLPEDVPTVGDEFQRNGYAATLVGKAHFQPAGPHDDDKSASVEKYPIVRDLDYWRQFHGPFYGFNHVEMNRNHCDEFHVGQHYAIWMEENGLKDWKKYFVEKPGIRSNREHSWDLPEKFHYSRWCADRTIKNIERHVEDDQPFFLWSSFMDPHPPYLVPEPWASMYDPADMQPGRLIPGELDAMPPQYALTQREKPDFSAWQETPFASHGFMSHRISDENLRKNIAVYYGMTSLMDHHIGRILDRLDSLGIADNTLVVFTTDHGHYLGQHGLTAKGAFHYEDALKVPFIVRQPGKVPAGARSTRLQSLVDLAPTFLDAAGIEVPGIMQGVSQLKAWTDDVPVRDHCIVENRHQPTAIHIRSFINDRYKITVYRQHEYGELFDLETDPNEQSNKWNDPAYSQIKADLLLKFVQAEIRREPTRMPRVWGA